MSTDQGVLRVSAIILLHAMIQNLVGCYMSNHVRLILELLNAQK